MLSELQELVCVDPVSGLLWGFGNSVSACAFGREAACAGCRRPSDSRGSRETFVFVVVSAQLVEPSAPAQLNKTKMARLPAGGGSLSHGDLQRLTREGFYPLTAWPPSQAVAEAAAPLASQRSKWSCPGWGRAENKGSGKVRRSPTNTHICFVHTSAFRFWFV